MELKQLKDYISNFPKGTVFNYSLSHPFSWRGSYDEVAFDIEQKESTREEILKNIELAYSEKFYGYKGGEYKYHDYTDIHFEQDSSRWSDGGYCSELIASIQGGKPYKSQEQRLVELAFS